MWLPLLSHIEVILSFRTPKAQSSIKSGSNHHRSQAILECLLEAMSCELIVPFIKIQCSKWRCTSKCKTFLCMGRKQDAWYTLPLHVLLLLHFPVIFSFVQWGNKEKSQRQNDGSACCFCSSFLHSTPPNVSRITCDWHAVLGAVPRNFERILWEKCVFLLHWCIQPCTRGRLHTRGR